MSALTQAQYRRLTARQLTGRRARLVRAVQILAGLRVPAGTLVTITGKYAGLDIITDRCGCCGVQLIARHIPPGDVELVDGSRGVVQQDVP